MKTSRKQKKMQKHVGSALAAAIGAGGDDEQLYHFAPFTMAGAVAAGVAHEINNPMTAVLGFSSALLSRVNSGENIDRSDLASYLQIIRDEAVRCRDIVDHFHRFAWSGAVKKGGSSSLAECVVGALKLVSMKALRSEISIVNEIREDHVVACETVRLEQVLVCLLLNRIFRCGPGNVITVSARRSTYPGMTAVMVSDGHCSMAEEYCNDDTAFIVTIRAPEKRYGIGLGFCRTSVEMQGGKFERVSESGKGTVITLHLPAADMTDIRKRA